MNFEFWFKKHWPGQKFGDCIQDEALEVGWHCCKQEILKILEKELKSLMIKKLIINIKKL